jgi:hypothetical protein
MRDTVSNLFSKTGNPAVATHIAPEPGITHIAPERQEGAARILRCFKDEAGCTKLFRVSKQLLQLCSKEVCNSDSREA